ncbi:MAG: hypothetical protein ACFFE5_12755 [Candidatus Thorarchaeota archaeon]
MALFLVKDVGENIIFKIGIGNSDWIFFTIVIILMICIGGLTAYLIFRNRKTNRTRRR